jgi:phosphate:Na+ symporter
MVALAGSPARQVANFHTLFNVALAVVFIGLLDPLARVCAKFIPPGPDAHDPGAPQYLKPAVIQSPNLALADATREVLRMVDIVQSMLTIFLDALRNDDRKQLAALADMDDDLDRLHNAVKRHLTEISRQEGLSEADAKRCSDILAFTINLEHIGDILDKNLRELAAKKIKRKLKFSDDGLEEITSMHRCLLDNLHLATSVFVIGDIHSARALLAEKDRMRDLEQAANENHLRRLREGKTESIETSSLHIDITRDLKRITAHMASVAYPILERTGSIRRSRLLEDEPVAVDQKGRAN